MRRAIAVVVVLDAVASDARANPPPVQVLPDPKIEAPSATEAPSMVRRHASGCFAFFASGGALLVTCPDELTSEGVGASLQKQPSGRCQHVPLRSGTPGAKQGYTPCPVVFDRVVAAGEIDPASRALLERKRPMSPSPPWSPPVPARLAADDARPPEGCGYAPASSPNPVGPMLLLTAFVRRRRKS